MNDLVCIIGSGGFAAEITEYIKNNNTHLNKKIKIKGYFDIDDTQYRKYKFESPFLGNERAYDFKKSDNIIIAVVNPDIRKKILKYFISIDSYLYNFIHHSCFIPKTSSIGIGNIFCPNVMIGPNVNISDYNVFNYNTSVPHDCKIDNGNIFSPYVQLTGFVQIGSDNLFGTSTVVMPNIKIGNNNRLQANIVIERNIKSDNLVVVKQKTIKIPLYKEKS